jgi:hypothetical protein
MHGTPIYIWEDQEAVVIYEFVFRDASQLTKASCAGDVTDSY